MRRSGRHPEGDNQEPSLFDLPLDLPDRDRLPPERIDPEDEDDFAAPAVSPPPPLTPLTASPSPPLAASPPPPARPRPARLDPPPVERLEKSAPRRPQPAPVPVAPALETGAPGRARLGTRLAAGLADLLVHAAIAAVALGGARLLGAEPTLDEWPPLLLFLLSFSFLYTILPLAFWGQTLGMTWAGIASRNRDGEPLTFDQTARRWLGGLLTTATLGLPLLVAIRGRTLTDLLSSSATYRLG
jgi:uncharacterized RDD family membrane protein YckC